MTISRRNLFKFLGCLPFIKLDTPKHPLLLDGVVKFQKEATAERFYVGLNPRTKYRWVAADITRDRLEKWAKDHPWFLKRYEKENIT